MKIKSFLLRSDLLELFSMLTLEQSGRVINAVLAYVNDREVPPLDMLCKYAYTGIRQRIDSDIIQYNEKCEKNRKNATQKRDTRKKQKAKKDVLSADVAAFAETAETSVGSDINASASSKATANDKDNTVQGVGDGRFAPPTPEELREYIASKGLGTDAGRFINYYEANGWRVGKNPMKDWRAAVRAWDAREKKETGYDMGSLEGCLTE